MAKPDFKRLKSQAEKFRGKGKLEKALEIYKEIEEKGGADAKVYQKMAEIYLKINNENSAIETYKKAMRKYLDEGFLLQAIAVGKILQELVPDDKALQEEVEQVLAKRHKTTIGKITPVKVAVQKAEKKALLEKEPKTKIQEKAEKAEIEKAIPIPPEKEEKPAERIETILFTPLDEKAFTRIYEKLHSLKVPAGVKICREGEEGDSIFIIVQGEAQVSKLTPDGKEKIIAKLGKGDFFGEFGYFMDSRRQATVRAITDLELLEITRKDMDEIIAEFPQVREVMLRFYKERVLDNFLALNPLTQSLSPQERKKLIEKFELKEYEPGEAVVVEGEEGDAMFLIKSGRVEVTTIDPRDKRRLTLARLGPGEFFGEVSLIKNKPRTATVTALTPLELMVINRERFNELVKEHPEIVSLLEETIEKRVEDTIQKIISKEK